MTDKSKEQRITELLKELEQPNISQEQELNLCFEISKIERTQKSAEIALKYLNDKDLKSKICAKSIVESFGWRDKIPLSDLPFPGKLNNSDLKEVLKFVSINTIKYFSPFWNYQEKDRILENIDEETKKEIGYDFDWINSHFIEHFNENKYTNYLNQINELLNLLEKNGKIKQDGNVQYSNPKNSILLKKMEEKISGFRHSTGRKENADLKNELNQIPAYRYPYKLCYEYLIEISDFVRRHGIYDLLHIYEQVPNQLIQSGFVLSMKNEDSDKMIKLLDSIKTGYLQEYSKYLNTFNEFVLLHHRANNQKELEKILKGILEKLNKPIKLSKKDLKNIKEIKSIKNKFFKNRNESIVENIIKKIDRIIYDPEYEALGWFMDLKVIVDNLLFYPCKKSYQKLISLAKSSHYYARRFAIMNLELMHEFDKIPTSPKSIIDELNDENLLTLLKYIDFNDLSQISNLWNYTQKDRILNLVKESEREKFYNSFNESIFDWEDYQAGEKRIKSLVDYLKKSKLLIKDSNKNIQKGNIKKSIYIQMYKDKHSKYKFEIKDKSKLEIDDSTKLMIEKSKQILEFTIDKKQLSKALNMVFKYYMKEGLLPLEDHILEMKNEYIQKGFECLVCGVDPDIIQKFMDTNKKLLLDEYESNLNSIINILVFIKDMVSPHIIRDYANLNLSQENRIQRNKL